MTDPAGTLEKALDLPARSPALRGEGRAEPLKAEHEHLPPSAGLNLTLGEVHGYPFNLNPAAGGTFQGVGSVLVGSVECNNEVNS